MTANQICKTNAANAAFEASRYRALAAALRQCGLTDTPAAYEAEAIAQDAKASKALAYLRH